jgi:hypothetical protein
MSSEPPRTENSRHGWTLGRARWILTLAVVAAALAATVAAGAVLAGCGSSNAGSADTGSPAADSITQPPITTYTDTPADDNGVSTTVAAPDPNEQEDLKLVQIVDVAIAAETDYIVVQFKAPARLAKTWQAGAVSVTDEKSHITYSDIPLAPVLGQLFGRPAADDQMGYVMFTNSPPLHKGAIVTVKLGGFTQGRIVVK